MEESKALETKVGDQGAARRVPFPCPSPVGSSPMDTAARGPQLLTPLCRVRVGQAQAGGRAKNVHGVGGRLQRKRRGAQSLPGGEPMVFPSTHTPL